MKKITTYSNWCYIDRLEGQDLMSGDMLRMVFPDGTETKEKVLVEEYNEPSSDHGHPITIPIKKAFVWRKVSGIKTKVYLAGKVKAEFIKKKPRPSQKKRVRKKIC